MDTTERSLGTRHKVLEQAGKVFSEKGFRQATVREIAARAGANLNSVNYYFRDKEGLYRAVIEAAHEAIDADEELQPARDPTLDPKLRLRAFIAVFLRRVMGGQDSAVHVGRLMMMELAEPTGALDMVVDKFIRPRFRLLGEIVRGLMDEQVSQQQVELCVQSIIGQCVHLVNSRAVTSRLMPYLTYTPEDLERMAEHVSEFSLCALRQMGNGNGKGEGQ
ncbi:MAG: CerR family C-terminal domain-containing protein [Phycisphaerales bacterium]|nr:CerR family C-terminal domain-containing protein [Phycisphaerales bacterium]